MKLALIAVFVLIVYNIWSNLKRVRGIRQEQRQRENAQDQRWQMFSRQLAGVEALKKQFFNATSQLTQAKQKELWMPVSERCAQAGGFFMVHDMSRAMARLNDAIADAAQIMLENGVTPIKQESASVQ